MPLAAGGISSKSGFRSVCAGLTGEMEVKLHHEFMMRSLAIQALQAKLSPLTNCRRVHAFISNFPLRCNLICGQRIPELEFLTEHESSYCSIRSRRKDAGSPALGSFKVTSLSWKV